MPEIQIFKAVKHWVEFNNDVKPDDVKEVVSQVRLPLISLEDLLSIVRPTQILDADFLLDAIHVKTRSRIIRLPHRGRLCPDENIATANHGARVTQGICDGFSLLEASDHSYDMEKVNFLAICCEPHDNFCFNRAILVTRYRRRMMKLE